MATVTTNSVFTIIKQNDVITTEGDIVIANGSGEETRLGIGTNGQVLVSDGTTLGWGAPVDVNTYVDGATFAAGIITLTNVDAGTGTDITIDLNDFVASNEIVNDLTTGGTAAVLSAQQGVALKALIDAVDVITTRGDITVGDASGDPTRLALGTNGQVLTSDGTDAAWATPTAEGIDDTLAVGQTLTANRNVVLGGFSMGINQTEFLTGGSSSAGMMVDDGTTFGSQAVMMGAGDMAGTNTVFVAQGSFANIEYTDQTVSNKVQIATTKAALDATDGTNDATVEANSDGDIILNSSTGKYFTGSSTLATQPAAVVAQTTFPIVIDVATGELLKGSAAASSPVTTRGDIITTSAGGAEQRLALGTTGQVLVSDGTDAVWGASTPITTRGDVVIGDASADDVRLAVGTAGQVLTADGTDVAWADNGIDTTLALGQALTADRNIDPDGNQWAVNSALLGSGTGAMIRVDDDGTTPAVQQIAGSLAGANSSMILNTTGADMTFADASGDGGTVNLTATRLQLQAGDGTNAAEVQPNADGELILRSSTSVYTLGNGDGTQVPPAVAAETVSSLVFDQATGKILAGVDPATADGIDDVLAIGQSLTANRDTALADFYFGMNWADFIAGGSAKAGFIVDDGTGGLGAQAFALGVGDFAGQHTAVIGLQGSGGFEHYSAAKADVWKLELNETVGASLMNKMAGDAITSRVTVFNSEVGLAAENQGYYFADLAVKDGSMIPTAKAAETTKALVVDTATGKILTEEVVDARYTFGGASVTATAGSLIVAAASSTINIPAAPVDGDFIKVAPANEDWSTIAATFDNGAGAATIMNGQTLEAGNYVLTLIYDGTNTNWFGTKGG